MSGVIKVLLIEADRTWQNIIWAKVNDEYIQIVPVLTVEDALQALVDTSLGRIDVVVVSDVTRGNASRFSDAISQVRRCFAGTIFAMGDSSFSRALLSQVGCEHYVLKPHLARALNDLYRPVAVA